MAAKAGKQVLSQFKDHVEELSGTWYEGDDRQAFRHAAFQLIAPDATLSDEQVIEMTAIDKKDDLEVDGWFVDEGSETFLIFQSVGGDNRASEESVTKFWQSVEELLNPERVAQNQNQSVRELSQELNDKLQADYRISMVFASKAGFVPSAIKYAKSRHDGERPFKLLDNTETVCRCSLELWDESDIAKAFDDYKAGFTGDSPNVTLSLSQEWSYVVDNGELESIRATVSAQEIVRVFKEQGYRLFLLNPRGPIANSKTNKYIQSTLDSSKGRRTFHLLNNGLCATCDGFDVAADAKNLLVKNFQIVNGCQTTVTLSKRTEAELKQTFVDLKLVVADTALAEEIASSSNSQTALRARDYTSFERQQRHLQFDFGELQPPWYYEIKQGYWRFVLTDKNKARFKTGQKKRHIEVQPLAQASLAFRGYPSEALDRVRFVFQGIRSSEDREWYERAFPSGVKAQQLILPWRSLQYVLKNKVSLRFSNFHVLWLLSRTLRDHYGISGESYFSNDLSTRLASEMESWIPDMVSVADRACNYAYRSALAILNEDIESRDFFRASGELRKGVSPIQLLLEGCEFELGFAADSDRDPRAKLPD